MSPVELHDTIFKRKSIRNYQSQPLDAALLADVTAFLSDLVPLYSNIKTEVKILNSVKVKPGQSPHYIVIFSERKPGYYENAGFILQQVDLYLSAKGVGTCWRGIVQKKSRLKKASALYYVIALAIGYANEPLHRERLDQFDRKSKESIWKVSDGDDMLEAVRLAPSAMNRQPWLFIGKREEIDVFCQKTNVILKLFLGPLDRISIGIALYHFWCVAHHLGKKVETIRRNLVKTSSPSNYYYITSFKIIE